jgi:hypothetical protein
MGFLENHPMVFLENLPMGKIKEIITWVSLSKFPHGIPRKSLHGLASKNLLMGFLENFPINELEEISPWSS